MPKQDAWNISTISILSRLKVDHPAPTHVNVSDLKYTILDNDHVFRNAQELAELWSCDTSKLPNSYVAFRPARLALHESIVGVVTTVQVEDEDEMRAVVERVHKAVLNDPAFLALEGMRKEIQSNVEKSVDAFLSNPFNPQSSDNTRIVKCCTDVHNRTNDYVFGRFQAGYTERDAMIALATDQLFAKDASNLIKKMVTATIENDASIELITVPEQSKRTTLLVTGGISSGKGSSVATIKNSAEQAGLAWRDLVKVNGDSLKPLFLSPGSQHIKPELYSQLTQEEASILTKIKIKGALREMVNERRAPHMFFDQTRIEDDAKWGVENEGQVIGLIVSTDVESAILRAAERGKVTNRYEATQNIINNHKAVAEELFTALGPLKGKNAEFTVVDNNGSQHSIPVSVMKLDAKNGAIEILDDAKLEKFTRKCNINPSATSVESLYVGTKTNETYIKDLKEKSNYTVASLRIIATTPVIQVPEEDDSSRRTLNN